MFRSSLAAIAIVSLGQTASSQDDTEAQAATPPPPCSEDAFHDFDFWLGDWDVTTPDGTFAGNNKITSEENGCLVLETWTSVNGGTGQSYNHYNPVTEKWRQLWVSSGAIIDYEGGLTETGSMKLAGTITYITSLVTADFTGEWTPNEDGTVTQHFEQYDAETDQWNPWFTGLYTLSETPTP